jgi:predicted methyltransferase
MTLIRSTVLVIFGFACAPVGFAAQSAGSASPELSAALSDDHRPAAQVRQDSDRRPADVIMFAGIKSGDRVADFMAGNAYFTRLFSVLVGAGGHVYAFLPAEEIQSCPASEIEGTRSVEHDPTYSNVSVLTAAVERFALPETVDVIWTSQNYHDLHDPFMGPANVAIVNRAFFAALKPGGVLVIIDHAAESGSGIRDTDTLHRIDPARLRTEVEAAGFVFEAESNALRNSHDTHRLRVFDPGIRGKTDQVVYRFRKPVATGP